MSETTGPGRPSKYKPEYCDLLIEHMAEGYSFEAFAGLIDVNRDTLYEWEKVHPEFKEAKSIAVAKGQYKWEGLGIKHIINESENSAGIGGSSKSLNATVWIFNMKNRFGWRDRQPDEVDKTIINNTNNIQSKTDEDLKLRAKELAQKILADDESKS